MKISKLIIAYFCAALLLAAASGCIGQGGKPGYEVRAPLSSSLEEQGDVKEERDNIPNIEVQEAQEDETAPSADTAGPDQKHGQSIDAGKKTGKPPEPSPQKAEKNPQPAGAHQTHGTDGHNSPSGPGNTAGDIEEAAEPSQDENKTICTIAVYGDDYTILEPTEVEFKDGDSVLSILKKITRENKIQMEYRGGEKARAYVEGIDNLYEFDRGAESGWMYNVNGKYPNYSCGAYNVKKGDAIEWRYTKELGRDLGADMKDW